MTTTTMIGLAAMVLSTGGTIASHLAEERKLDEKIERKVNEALAEREKEQEEDYKIEE